MKGVRSLFLHPHALKQGESINIFNATGQKGHSH